MEFMWDPYKEGVCDSNNKVHNNTCMFVFRNDCQQSLKLSHQSMILEKSNFIEIFTMSFRFLAISYLALSRWIVWNSKNIKIIFKINSVDYFFNWCSYNYGIECKFSSTVKT